MSIPLGMFKNAISVSDFLIGYNIKLKLVRMEKKVCLGLFIEHFY